MESGGGGHVLVAVIAGIVVAPDRRDRHQPSLVRRCSLLNGLVKGVTHVSPDCLSLQTYTQNAVFL
jgi:hypothetical protein